MISEVEKVPIPPSRLRNYFKSIADHKDVNKIVLMLTSAVNSFREDVASVLQAFSRFHFIWEEDRDKAVEVVNCHMTQTDSSMLVASQKLVTHSFSNLEQRIVISKAIQFGTSWP